MFELFKKLWQKICRGIFSEKKWCWPRHSEVLILDASRKEVLMEYLRPWNPEVLYLRGEQFNMPVFLASFFKRGRRVDAYTDCFVEKVSPRLIVTLIDNDVNFYSISERHPDIKTLFIQNGWRCNYSSVFEIFDDLDFETTSKFFVDYMLVLGSGIGKKYSQCIGGESVIVGSIENNLVRKERSPQQGVIAYVSQWRNSLGMSMGGVFFSFEDFWAKPDRLVVKCLMQYSKIKNKRLMIIPAVRRQFSEDLRSKEEAYFRDLLGSEPEFLCPSGPSPSYHAADSAEVVVTVDSNLGYESVARGNKTAIFPVRGHFARDPSRNYGWPGVFPDEGLFWTNNPDPDSFVRILDYLFEVDDAQLREDVRASNFSSIMEYDPGNSVIRETLERILGAPPAP